MECIAISGLRGNGALGWVLAPLRLARAMAQALVVIMRQRPVVVLGMGGFVAGPGGLVTRFLHKPLVIHEQNAIAGLTNRKLARMATKVFEAFPGTFPAKLQAAACGNPVRAAIVQLPTPAERFVGRDARLRLLVLGGSRGAQALNETLPQALAQIDAAQRPEVWHQAGAANIDAARAAYQAAGVDGRVDAFVDDMAAAYAWADLVICRSGALTVAELAAAGVGAVLVPFPHAVDDHQTANARYLSDAGAAELMQQSALTAEGLAAVLHGFVEDCAAGRSRLLAMAEQARAKAIVAAAKTVADGCLEVCHG